MTVGLPPRKKHQNQRVNKGNSMNIERVDYDLLKKWFCDRCFNYCKLKIDAQSKNKKGCEWIVDESEEGYAYDQLFNSLESPLEDLMLEVIFIIKMANRGGSNIINAHYCEAKRILEENELGDLLDGIPDGEKN